MAVESERGFGVQAIVEIAAKLEIPPAALVTLFHGKFRETPAFGWVSGGRRTKISERQRDATAPGPRTDDFHDGKQINEILIRETTEIKRTMTIRIVEHARPGSSLEEGASRKGHQLRVPRRIVQGIASDQ